MLAIYKLPFENVLVPFVGKSESFKRKSFATVTNFNFLQSLSSVRDIESVFKITAIEIICHVSENKINMGVAISECSKPVIGKLLCT